MGARAEVCDLTTLNLDFTTLNLVFRDEVRVRDLASGGLGCSLVGVRAGSWMQPLGSLEGD